MRRKNYRHLKDLHKFKWSNLSPHFSVRRKQGKQPLWRKFCWPLVRWVVPRNGKKLP